MWLVLTGNFFSELKHDGLQRIQHRLALHLVHYSKVLRHQGRQQRPDDIRRTLPHIHTYIRKENIDRELKYSTTNNIIFLYTV